MKKKLVLLGVMLISAVTVLIISCNKNNTDQKIAVEQKMKTATTSSQAELTLIGHEEPGQGNVITGHMEDLASYWQEYLLNELNVTTTLENFVILSKIDEQDNNSPYYLLQATDNAGHKIATELVKIGSEFYFQQITGTSVTCTGCATGCNPERVGKKYYCDAYCGLNCTKSVTVSFDRVFVF